MLTFMFAVTSFHSDTFNLFKFHSRNISILTFYRNVLSPVKLSAEWKQNRLTVRYTRAVIFEEMWLDYKLVIASYDTQLTSD